MSQGRCPRTPYHLLEKVDENFDFCLLNCFCQNRLHKLGLMLTVGIHIIPVSFCKFFLDALIFVPSFRVLPQIVTESNVLQIRLCIFVADI